MRDNSRVQETGFACKAMIRIALELGSSYIGLDIESACPCGRLKRAHGDRPIQPITMERDSV